MIFQLLCRTFKWFRKCCRSPFFLSEYAFDKERLHIEMILLVNGYPPQFLQHHFNRFFQLNQAVQVLTDLDEQQYQQLHDAKRSINE
jgi:hypothetical protein